MDSSLDIEQPKESLTQNITSAGAARTAPPTSSGAKSEKGNDAPIPLIFFLYFCMLLFCVFAKPAIPGETRRGGDSRHRRGRRKKKEKIDPAERRKLVNAALCTKRVIGHNECNAIVLEDEEVALAQPSPSLRDGIDLTAAMEAPIQSEQQARDGKEEEDSSFCMICLEPYLVGQDVSWSRDMRCRHVFHNECIAEWLMKHDECPCCRAQYLPSKENTHETEEEGDCDDDDDDLNGDSVAFIIMSGLVSSVRRARRRYTSIIAENAPGTVALETVAAGPILDNEVDNMNSESDSAVACNAGLTFGRVVLRKLSSGLYNPVDGQNAPQVKAAEEGDIEQFHIGNDPHQSELDALSGDHEVAGEGMVDVELGQGEGHKNCDAALGEEANGFSISVRRRRSWGLGAVLSQGGDKDGGCDSHLQT